MYWTTFQLPFWAVAAIITIKTLMLLCVHRKLSFTNKMLISIPGFCLASTYLVFSLFPVDPEVQKFFGRNGLGILFFWYTILLFTTRKHHVNV
jgi:hypothetical protein